MALAAQVASERLVSVMFKNYKISVRKTTKILKIDKAYKQTIYRKENIVGI